jgi:hypothetical protein
MNCEILVSGNIRYNGVVYTPQEALKAGISVATISQATNLRSTILRGEFIRKVKYMKK